MWNNNFIIFIIACAWASKAAAAPGFLRGRDLLVRECDDMSLSECHDNEDRCKVIQRDGQKNLCVTYAEYYEYYYGGNNRIVKECEDMDLSECHDHDYRCEVIQRDGKKNICVDRYDYDTRIVKECEDMDLSECHDHDYRCEVIRRDGQKNLCVSKYDYFYDPYRDARDFIVTDACLTLLQCEVQGAIDDFKTPAIVKYFDSESICGCYAKGGQLYWAECSIYGDFEEELEGNKQRIYCYDIETSSYRLFNREVGHSHYHTHPHTMEDHLDPYYYDYEPV